MADQIPTLRTIPLRTRPLNPHALAWSPDAELAVGADESIHIFLPEFPSAALTSDIVSASDKLPAKSPVASREQFFAVKRRIPIPAAVNPRINAHIASAASLKEAAERMDEGEEEDEEELGDGVKITEGEGMEEEDVRDSMAYGLEPVTGFGGSLNQIVSLAWSPAGLGVNGRPVLSVVLTCGAVLMYGEAACEEQDVGKERAFERWRILWGIGGPLLGMGWRDSVKSLAWGKELGWGKGLLAYETDEDVVVVVAVQRRGDGLSDWTVREVGTFHAAGPHEEVDVYDADYVPSSTPFGIHWSPWTNNDTTMTATLGYIAPNYLGFRRIHLRSWPNNGDPEIAIEDVDAEGMCLHLATDAFFEWEERVFEQADGGLICRGIVATPLQARPFQVVVGEMRKEKEKEKEKNNRMMARHHVRDCGTMYPEVGEDGKVAQNPITGLIIHSSDIPSVQYTLTRLSATCTTPWLQTTLPTHPQWANEISRLITLQLPTSMAAHGVLSDSGSASSSSNSDSDSDSDADLPDFDPSAQIHPNRVRIWALTASPGGGTSAVLISRYVTMFPDRPQRSKVAFGWAGEPVGEMVLEGTEEDDDDDEGEDEQGDRLSAEGRAWEWMYGGGRPVVGVSLPLKMGKPSKKDVGPRGLLADLVDGHVCVFCEGKLEWREEGHYECVKGHSFAGCTSSGLPILTPGISRVCGLCRRRCIKPGEIARCLREHCGDSVAIPDAARTCGACGGRFIN